MLSGALCNLKVLQKKCTAKPNIVQFETILFATKVIEHVSDEHTVNYNAQALRLLMRHIFRISPLHSITISLRCEVFFVDH